MARSTKTQGEMLLEAGLVLSSELSLEAVLQRIIELATEVTGATYGALGVIGPDGGIIEFITTGISEEARRVIGHLPVGRGLLGALIADARPLRLHDIRDDPRSVGFPPNHPPMRSFLGAPIKARGKVFGNIYLTEKRGADDFSEEDERALVALAAQAGVAVENARLYEETRQREQRLEAVREISSLILQGEEPEQVLDLVASRARELMGADLAMIAVPNDSDESSLLLATAVGEHAEDLLGMRLPIEDSVSGAVMRSGEPIVLEDALSDDRVHQPLIQAGEMGPAMWVPLAARGQAFGTLAVSNLVGGRPFDQDDLIVVETFASQASVAIEYGRVQRELQRLVVMEDRERIAKELHDGVIQALFAVGMGLQATATLSRDPEIERRIESAVGDVDRVIRDLRNYIFGLRPGILADRQLDQALRHLAGEFEERTEVTTVVDVDGTVASELATRAADVVQLTREALSNVGRHANAATCRVTLRKGPGHTALLEIDDDGRGFDPAVGREGGQGLGNMRQRAASLGGSLDVASSAEEGTTVRVTIPL